MSTLDTNIPFEKLIRILNKHIDLSFKVAGARGEREIVMVDIYSTQLCVTQSKQNQYQNLLKSLRKSCEIFTSEPLF